jgi:hypothetical protein
MPIPYIGTEIPLIDWYSNSPGPPEVNMPHDAANEAIIAIQITSMVMVFLYFIGYKNVALKLKITTECTITTEKSGDVKRKKTKVKRQKHAYFYLFL